MVKRLIVVLIMAITTATAWGQSRETFTMSNGDVIGVSIQYIGSYEYYSNVDAYANYYSSIGRLSEDQLRLLRTMLNKYRIDRGDTYYVEFIIWPQFAREPTDNIAVIVGFNDNTTSYTYSAFRLPVERRR